MIKRLSLCVIVLALLSAAATGEIVTTSPATSHLFSESDLVRKCTVTSLSVMDRQTVETERGGRFVRETWRAVLQVEDLYKGTAASPIALEYSLNIDGRSTSQGLSVKIGETYLLFLKTAGTGTHTFFDQPFAARPFTSLPVQGGEPGVAKLESALVAAALQQNPDETLKAFSYLEDLDIHPESLVALSAVLTSPNWKLVWSYLTLQLKTKTPESVAAVRRFLDSYTGTEEPWFVGLQVITDPRAHDDLVELSYSRFGNVRAAAMVALRSMGGQKDAAFFIRRLDDPDRNMQYHAVIGLAQAFKMGGDYDGPGIGAFESMPEYYINLWKEWWKKREVTTPHAM
jgi:hypothetical protein